MLTRFAACLLLLVYISAQEIEHRGLFFGANNIPLQPRRAERLIPRVNPNRAPLIFSGGLGGSALMFKKTNVKDEPSYFCSSTTKDYYQAWIDASELIPYISQPCFLHDLQTFYANGTICSREGVSVKPKDFGGIEGIAYIGTGYIKQYTAYATPLMNYLVREAGYIPGVDFRGATYDWRLGPNEWSKGSYHDLKALIEDTYKRNNNTRVHVAGHSMGAPYFQNFLASFVNQEWKDKHVASLISLGGPFGGAPITLEQIAAGTNFGIKSFDGKTMKKVIRRFGSPTWMLPDETNTDIVFSTPTKNYTNAQLKQFFQDMNDTVIYDIYKTQMNAGNKAKSPGVATHCLYGYDIPTVLAVKMTSVDPPVGEIPQVAAWGVGDITVPLYSLAMCDEFAKGQDVSKYPVFVERYKNVTHGTIMTDEKVFARILSIITG
jgi:lysophospholipase-3